jgi:hypothetical protein
MARSLPTILVVLAGTLLAAPASAQFGSIFSNEPPRPPADVPSRPPAEPRAIPPGGLPPGPPPGARIQTQPLPPPPGAATAPIETIPSAPPPTAQTPPGPGQPPLTGLPPGQRQPRGAPQTASTGPQPGDEVITEPPAQKIPNPTAVFSGLDKITGRIITFEVAVNETVRFGALEVTPRACYTRPPTETANTDGFIEVDELTLQGELRRIFTGWMFVASPGLNAVEHPIYDVWLTECKGAAAPVVADAPAEPQPPAQRAPQRQQQRRATAPAQLPPPPR